ncbi:histidine kinase [Streptomyces sp. SM1P]
MLAAATGYGFRDAGAPSPFLDLLLPLAVLAVAVPLSRHRPGAAVVLVNGLCALGLADAATPANAQVLSVAVLSCLLGARVAGARGPLLVFVGCLVLDVATCAVLRVQPVWWFYTLAVLPAALLLPWLAGRYVRGRRELVREGWQLAHRLEERQHLVAERARLAERADIAADMHDSLGHVLSLVALRAGALELSPTSPTATEPTWPSCAGRSRTPWNTCGKRLRSCTTHRIRSRNRKGRREQPRADPPTTRWRTSWPGRSPSVCRSGGSGAVRSPRCRPWSNAACTGSCRRP